MGLSSGDGLSEPQAVGQEDNTLKAVRILEKPMTIPWDYDAKADVLCLYLGEPHPAVGVDIREGGILCCDEARKEVVGLTVRLSSRRSLDRACRRHLLDRDYLDVVP